MIDSSEESKRWLAFELQNSRFLKFVRNPFALQSVKASNKFL